MRMPFSVDPNLLVELSRKLISRDEIALVELVKNAWDADATCVEITIGNNILRISDNGTGMDEETIRNGWMRIGTTNKIRNPKSPSGRMVLGSKGIGRLAVFRLGKNVTLATKGKGSPALSVGMSIPEIPTDGNQQSSLDDFLYQFLILPDGRMEFPCEKTHGTVVSIENLNMEPVEKFINSVREGLSEIVSLSSGTGQDFSVYLITGGKCEKIHGREDLPDWNYEMECEVGLSDGQLSTGTKPSLQGKLRYRPGADGGIVEESIYVELGSWKSVSEGGVGRFRMRFEVWDLDMHSHYRRDIKKASGISVVRNGFVTVSPKIDWLDLNMRRVNQPTIRLSTNQIRGIVWISSDDNPNLEDKTDREGLLENVTYEIFRDNILKAMEILEKRRRAIRDQNKPGRGSPLQELDTSRLREIAGEAPQNIKNAISNEANRLDQARTKLEDILLGRDRMASVGILAARIVHETKNAISIINGGYTSLKKTIESMEDIPKEVKHKISMMVAAGETIYNVVDQLTPLIRFKTGKIAHVRLDEVISTLTILYSGDLTKMGIEILREYETGFELKIRASDIYVMLANLIDNSVYWMRRTDRKGGKISISAQRSTEWITLAVDDSGPGVGGVDPDLLFEPGVTAKPEGTGLGLATIRDIALSYRGNVRLSDKSVNGGARFEIFIPIDHPVRGG